MDTYQLRRPYCNPKKPILNCIYWNLKLQNLVKVEINIFFYDKKKKNSNIRYKQEKHFIFIIQHNSKAVTNC